MAEVTLFDSNGNAIAYIAEDDEHTIYTWSGTPVAYLEEGSENGSSIYGFNGRHLGWFVDGVVRNHGGLGVGGVSGAIGTFTNFEPFKGFREFKPFKNFKEFAPFKPFFSSNWDSGSFADFLQQGRE
jgi:hypothetical protein